MKTTDVILQTKVVVSDIVTVLIFADQFSLCKTRKAPVSVCNSERLLVRNRGLDLLLESDALPLLW
jgi:hypothetical protein